MTLSPVPASLEGVAVRLETLVEAIHRYRVETVRSLVDDEGWFLAEVARTMGCSRQLVSRLYHSSDDARRGAVPRPRIRLRNRHTTLPLPG
jgi:hypothetical protein